MRAQTATTAALLALLALALAAAEDAPEYPPPDVYSLHVVSHVRNRYAKTVVTSRVANTANVSREISFDAVLPETAFISGFVIEMDGKTYEAYVKGKEEAREEYQQAVQAGQGAAHVQLSARDSNMVSVSVNVEAQKKVTFNLTYEELLQRELGAYHLPINLNPGQIVNDLSVEVHINETSDITLLEVPSLQQSNDITDGENSTNPLAHTERPTPATAMVRWAPTKEEQAALRAEGVKGQLLVRYDVDHAASPNQILVSDDGYFVHFYSPADLPPLAKYIVFVLDVSGSMSGHKIDQLRQAMLSILDELNAHDNFTLVIFSSGSQVWWPDPENTTYTPYGHKGPETDAYAVVPATPENIARAKNFVGNLYANGGTEMHGALETALRVSKAAGTRPDAPLVMVLLTDGLPNGGPEAILKDYTAANMERGAALFTLAFGEDADFGFLRKLALRNGGFGRRIYEAADAHLQLRNFYRQVASPLLSSVNFTYGDGQVEEESLTRTRFPTLFRGSELVVSGRLRPVAPLLELKPVVVGEGSQRSRWPARLEKASSGERLWAFLTVRQLLDLDAATPNQTLKDRAKDIALKYSFVTPVTSLVVVKPNDTSAVDPQRAGGNRGGYFSPGGPPGAPGYASAGFGSSAGFRPNYFAPPMPAPVAAISSSDFYRPGVAVHDAVPETFVPFVSTTVHPAGQPQTLKISEITWLSSVSNSSHVTLEVNGTAQTYELALNKTESQLEECATPDGDRGRCRHLANCVLPNFAFSLPDFLHYLCVVDGSYVGACCPENTSPPAIIG